ncbi:helix-turn-helix domain-containing protein [Cupriavidus basilensis]|uniref:Helix-turn-helix transcriptional regulator n=1 Tax=Cupriavidus basilensis TaxID=68895 RepID=A0A643FXU9_9BURK|nr:helix-turn-helix transcriptional regulator [Cupriavidus basilensis]QOT79840.1 helix-turn-helix transcriptional regulator [Cupriavidus basilensis]
MAKDGKNVLNPDSFETFRKRALDKPETRRAYLAETQMLDEDPDTRFAMAGRVGSILRAARQKSGKTQAQQSADSGMLQSEISRIENGGGSLGPSMETIVNYAHALDMEVVLMLKPREAKLPLELIEPADESADEAKAVSDMSRVRLWGVF